MNEKMELAVSVSKDCCICKESSSDRTRLKENREFLSFLNLKIDLHLLENSLICKACLAKVQSAYKFKYLYMDSSQKMNKTDMKKYIICEICKDIIVPNDCIPLFDSVTKTKLKLIEYLSTELISKVEENPQTCERCYKSLLNFCTITKLLSTFSQCNIIYKTDLNEENELQTDADLNSISAEYFNVNVKEEIDCGKFKIKEEKENSSTVYEKFKLKSEEVDLKMECDNDSEQMWQHIVTSSSNTARSPNILKIAPKKQTFLHKTADFIEVLKCQMCQYETRNKFHLKRHTLIHKSCDEAVMFKCHICNCQTKHKDNLKKHMLIHAESEDVEMFKCQTCRYKTKYKNTLKRHMIVHKSPDEIETFKCHICEFETKYKIDLKRHTFVHKRPNEIEMFKCHICEYESKHKSVLKKHRLVHDGPDEVEMYKCQICRHETRYKDNLKKHMLIHENSDEKDMFKCQICQYKTKQKSALKSHMLVHQSPNEIEFFRCRICKFYTKRKSGLTRHMLIHKRSEEVEMFICQICNYKTKYKCALKTHMVVHKNPD